jgi:hypothetical protein
MWTDELVARLKKYVEANRFFVVKYRGSRVYNVDERNKEYNDTGWPAYYLRPCYDDPCDLEKTQPSDFQVFLLKPVEWTLDEPDWSEADAESWNEYVKATQK